jgi:RNA polymerase sigma-70 factor (ECF subfamily)
VTLRPTEVNGQPGAVVVDGDGRAFGVIGLEIADGRVQGISSIVNPDKLGHLGRPVGSLRDVLDRSRGAGDPGR